MSTLQWRPAVNALTVPPSCKMLFVPRNTVGYSELAAEIAAENPNWNAELVEAVLRAERKAIQRHLISGDQITLEDDFTYRVSFLGKLAQLERLPPEQKLPMIARCRRHPAQAERRAQPQGRAETDRHESPF